MRRLFIVLTVLMPMYGCDFNKMTQEKIDKQTREAKLQMESDISLARVDLEKSYTHIIKQSGDIILLNHAKGLYSSTIQTSRYIDSLRAVLNKLDDMDTKNVEQVKEMFVNSGLGDSVFNRVRGSYSLAIDIAAADTTKARLRGVKSRYSGEIRDQLFGLNSALGTYMVLYGIESELIRDGSRTLSERLPQ